MPTKTLIIFFVSYSYSAIIVYTNTLGLTTATRRLISVLPLIGIFFFLIKDKNQLLDGAGAGLLISPLIIGLLYELFDWISLKKHKRPFLLHAKGSGDLNGLGLRRYNKHFKLTDYLFSAIIIIVWLCFPILFIVVSARIFK